jgi:hypothetical protein
MPQPTENDTLAQMASLLRQGALTALVGAGVSARAGYPTWSDLLQAIHARAAERWRFDATLGFVLVKFALLVGTTEITF